MEDWIMQGHNLVKTFNAGRPNEVRPLRGINLQIPAQSFTLLKGASGSGKTTLLTILSGLAKPTSGEYYCKGEKVSRWSEKFLARFRRQHIGIVFQQFQLVSGLSARQNIALPLLPQKIRESRIKAMVEKVAESVNIAHRLNFKVDTLSGGELQRVAIARALVHEPEILFADEPTAHLDGESSERIMEIFRQLNAKGKTILISTHDPRAEAQAHPDLILNMQDGKIMPN